MEPVKPSQLRAVARIGDGLVYAAGLAGVVAGGLLFRDGDAGMAVVAWVVTFVAGAGLRLTAWLARAMAELLERGQRIEEELTRPPSPPAPTLREEPRAPVDPYRRWGGWH
ncbi:MAG TPA: hypothetical protein VG452_11535 [Egibacteraceae bacterium]|nr:hypothetical protein [Egibacteraceae bacterium]